MKRFVWATILCATAALLCCFAILPSTGQPTEKPSGVLFSEGFDDSRLLQRGWYDGDKFTISEKQPSGGKGCIEYRWNVNTTTPASSSGIRHLFEPTDTIYLRFSIRLSKGWGWTGRAYHPHLITFMTTENDKFRGPAASHHRRRPALHRFPEDEVQPIVLTKPGIATTGEGVFVAPGYGKQRYTVFHVDTRLCACFGVARYSSLVPREVG
jgi:hypothetical protein